MSGVYADPEELQLFAERFRSQIEELRQLSHTISRTLDGVDSWRDGKRSEFEYHLEPLLAQIASVADYSEGDLLPWLHSKITELENYSA